MFLLKLSALLFVCGWREDVNLCFVPSNAQSALSNSDLKADPRSEISVLAPNIMNKWSNKSLAVSSAPQVFAGSIIKNKLKESTRTNAY